MGNQTDYFERIAHKPKWNIGDRVTGLHQKIRFIGTVGVENVLSADEGPRVTVHLDLPIAKNTQVIRVKPKDIKALKTFD